MGLLKPAGKSSISSRKLTQHGSKHDKQLMKLAAASRNAASSRPKGKK